ncbi:hypothetical protein M3Y95_00776100 [Aphelenchoides besseyi]|nr:hypothetical protein M3Y95_00776100 [Aphelenchoides besseyi]
MLPIQLNPQARTQFIADMIHKFPNKDAKMFAEDSRSVYSPPMKNLRALMFNTEQSAYVRLFFSSKRIEIVWPKVDGAENESNHWREDQSKFMELNTPLTDQTDDGQIAFHEENGDVVWFAFAFFPELVALELIGRHVNQLKVHESLTTDHVEEIIHRFSSIDYLIIPRYAEDVGLSLIQHFAPTLQYLDCSFTIPLHQNFPELRLKRYRSLDTAQWENYDRKVHRMIKMPIDEIDTTHAGTIFGFDEDVEFHPQIQTIRSNIYGHRGFSWLDRTSLSSRLDYLKRRANGLKYYELLFQQCAKENWQTPTKDYKLSDMQLYRETVLFATLFHDNLPAAVGYPFRVHFTRYDWKFFENERLPCVALKLTATFESAQFELGIRGDPKPFIQETLEFKQLKDFGPLLNSFLEKFCVYLNSRFNIPFELETQS